ncbi:MAG: hypothetical protein U0822_19230 [Anaerolineae bacterium]
MIVYNSRRQRATLKNQPLAHGGEGLVYEIEGQAGLIAKVYTTRRADYERKLTWMMYNPPDQPKQPTGHASIAWPSDLLYDQRGTFIGYVMPRIRSAAPLLNVFNPRRRSQTLPGFDWRYLHRTGRNLAAALSAIHARDYVVGDVNESNILVTPAALVTFIDTDSFQVQATYNSQPVFYPCPVGKPEYTPPELQGRTFQTVRRGPEADRFGLGVLIFQLLMDGSHPFRSRWYGQGDPPSVAEKISRGWFPYSALAADPIQPPTTIPRLSMLHPGVENLVYRCFTDGYQDPGKRPKPEEWEQALRQAESALIVCSKGHWFSNHLPRCPVCDPTVIRSGATVVTPPQTNGSRPATAAAAATAAGTAAKATPTPTPRPAPAPKPKPQPAAAKAATAPPPPASGPRPSTSAAPGAAPRPGTPGPTGTAAPNPSASRTTPPPTGSGSAAWKARPASPPPGGTKRATGSYSGTQRVYGAPPNPNARPYSSPPPSWGSPPRSRPQPSTSTGAGTLAASLFGSLLQPFMRSYTPQQQRGFIRRWLGAIIGAVAAFLWDWAIDIVPIPYRMRDVAHRYRRQSFATVMAVTVAFTIWVSVGGPGALWSWTWSSAAAAAPGVIAAAQSAPGKVQELATQAQSLIHQQHTVTVDARQGWLPTDILVEKGDKVSFSIDGGGWTVAQGGTATLGAGSGTPCAQTHPQGPCPQPLPSAPDGALIARIGGQVFPVLPNSYTIAEETGALSLRVNDADSALGDNSGSLQVTVTVSH